MDMNAAWAKNAPILVLAIAKLQRSSGAVNSHAFYDLGQAVAHLNFQASALGLFVHQMAGFDAEKARQSFDLPEGYEAFTAFAIGYAGNVDDLPEAMRTRETAARSRKPLTDFVFTEQWGNPLVLTPEESEIATA